MTEPIHLRPTAPLADRVLLPGDPGRALLLAQALLAEPKMFNHNRGLWGYSGDALLDGRPLTIQSTGLGAPSAAIVIAELADLGATTLLRVGTCRGFGAGLTLGQLLIVSEAIAEDGTSRALGAAGRVAPSADLLARLRRAGGETTASGVTVSTDLFYEGRPGAETAWAQAGAVVVEMESATLFALAHRRGIEAGTVLIVSDLRHGDRVRIDDEPLRDAEHRLGELAVCALADGSSEALPPES